MWLYGLLYRPGDRRTWHSFAVTRPSWHSSPTRVRTDTSIDLISIDVIFKSWEYFKTPWRENAPNMPEKGRENKMTFPHESLIKLFADDTKLYAHISPTNPSTLLDW